MTELSITDQIIAEIEQTVTPEDIDRQLELEERMTTVGVERYWSTVQRNKERGQETRNKPVKRLLSPAVEALKAGIECFILEVGLKKSAGVKHSAVQYLQMIEPEVAALLTVRTVLDNCLSTGHLTRTSRQIGAYIEEELAFRQFKQEDKKAFDFLVKRCKQLNAGSYGRNKNTMLHNMRAREIHYDTWTEATKVLVGSKLIELMVQWTGLVSIELRKTSGKSVTYYVEPTQQTMEWIEKEHSICEALSPMYLPTVIPPKPWVSISEGGYWGPKIRDVNLVKVRSKALIEDLSDQEMPEVYDAVNAMQHTAWSVNTKILKTAKELWAIGSEHGGIPAAEDKDLPFKPLFLEQDTPYEHWTEEQKAQFKDWKRSATDIYKYNGRIKAQRLRFLRVISIAESFQDEEAIYFPHTLDFRGRAYALPLFLNPQGPDIAKAMLEFSRGVPITDQEGADWLSIHGSGCYGFDKASMSDRVKWVEEHEEQIIACAEDPISARLWLEADKPYQFLAFCFDYAEFRKEGFGYVSCLPVQMDGSCNGLQNFSAMLRDPIGGAAVNLIPSELPSDIYQKVADKVLEKVREDSLSECDKTRDLALGWLELGIDRKVCKRPVMTLPYGAKQFGFKNQVYEDTLVPIKFQADDREFPWEGSPWAAADYLGTIIWDSVGKVVVAAMEAMQWLQDAAKVASAAKLPLGWKTEDGLYIVQSYAKLRKKNVKLTFGDSVIQLKIASEDRSTLDTKRQANGIAPNWIHSMDAAHMRATVRACWRAGVRSFSLIHDSYGTHAGNAWALAELLRSEFVRIYTENNVLQDFRDQLIAQLPEGTDIEPIPPMGDLDLDLVNQSKYFFA